MLRHLLLLSFCLLLPCCGRPVICAFQRVAAEAGKHITLEGQEMDMTTAGLARMNMILHDFPATTRKGIFMIDASKGFIKDGNKNRLRERDLHQIVDVFTNAEEHPGYSRLVPHDEIEKNDFNLNLPRYIDTQEAEDIQDNRRPPSRWYKKYPQLTEAEIQTLVVYDKWLTTLAAAIQGELDRVSQTLTSRIRLLADRYAAPLPQIVDEVEQLAAKVAAHLQKMGVY